MKILILSLVTFTASSVVSAPSAPIELLGKTLVIHFASLVPLQRAIVLDRLGVPLGELSSASLTEESDFYTAVLQSMLNEKSPLVNRVGGDKVIKNIHRQVGEPHLASYLPATTSLSAEDVLASLKIRMNTSSSDDYTTVLLSTNFDLESLIFKLSKLLGDTGRRDILEDLNKLDFEEMKKLLYRVSFAWSLWVQQTASNFEARKPLTGTLNDQEDLLQTNMVEKQQGLNALKHYDKLSSADMKIMKRLEKLVAEWDKIAAMPLSPERDKAVNGLYADFISNNNTFARHRRFSNLAEEVLSRDKIGLALLDDLTPATMYALDSLNFILRSSFNGRRLNSEDREFTQQHLRKLLDEELQKLLADKKG